MPDRSTDALREQLAAYLAGELDGVDVSALEQRMVDEPDVAAMADDMADLLAGLSMVADVEPPAGYGERLRTHVAAEVGTAELRTALDGSPASSTSSTSRSDVDDLVSSSGAAAATGWATSTTSSSGGGAAARARLRWFQRPELAVAAVVLLTAVAGISVLSGGFGTSGDQSAEFADQGEADTADDLALQPETAAQDESAEAEVVEEEMMDAESAESMASGAEEDSAMSDEDESAAAIQADPAAPTDDEAAMDAGAMADAEPTNGRTTAPMAVDPRTDRPTVTELGVVRAEDLGGLVADLPGVRGVLGQPADLTEQVAAAYRDELLRADPFGDGTPAGRCLGDIFDDQVVPAASTLVQLDGEQRLAYGMVRATDGNTFDQVDVWVVDPGSCEISQILAVE